MKTDSTELVSTASRPHAGRLQETSYPIGEFIDARYGDLDTNGHINNLALESLHQNICATLVTRVFKPTGRMSEAIRIVTATNVVHFIREAHWPVRIQAAIGIGRIGRTSFVASSGLFVGDTCITLCDAVMVTLDDLGPTPIPEGAREGLESLRLLID